MAGCVQEKSYLYSYYGEIDLVKKQLPGFSEHDIRVEVARRFRLRFTVDRGSEDKDNNPTDVISESVSFTLENGCVFYPQYGENGTYLDALHQNQKKFSKSYSESDHQTSRLAEEAFRNGATTVVLSYAREGETNRDLIIMKYDPETKEGKTFIMNTTVNGQEHSYNKILEIAKERFSDLTAIMPTATSGILTDTAILPKQVQNAVSSTSLAESVYTGATQIMNDSVTTARYAAMHVAGDVRETWIDIRDFFNRKRDEKMQKRQNALLSAEPTIPTKQTQQSEQKQLVPSEKDIETATRDLSTSAFFTLKEPVVTISALFALDVLSRIPEIEKKKPDDMKRTRLEHIFVHTFISETVKPTKLSENNTETKLIFSISRKLTEFVSGDMPSEKTLRIPDSETMGFFDAYRFFIGEKQQHNPEKKEIQKKAARVNYERFIALTTPEEQKEYQTLERLAILYIALVMKTQEQPKTQLKELQQKVRKSDVPVFRLSQAITVLFLFSQCALFDGLFEKRGRGIRENSDITTREKTFIRQTEETPWLLLSIIWYLAQIREQGFSIQTNPKKKKVKKQKYKRVVQLPNIGVLYTYEK